MSHRIRVLVVDDHALVRQGLCALIGTSPDMEVVGEAADGQEALEKAEALNPDVTLMDLVMPRMDGLEAIRQIRRQNPDARILALTSFAQDRRVLQAIQAGALGFLLKDSSCDDLIRAIREVHLGSLSLQPALAVKVARELSRQTQRRDIDELTNRELEVLKLLAHGLTNQDIAEKLVLSEVTVNGHVSSILGKLRVGNRTQAVLVALREGLADLDSN
jgi:two-component system, NarL family, response regulator LiaR